MDSRGNPYTIFKPVELAEDKLFSVDRRIGGLDVNTGRISGSYVVTVSNDGDQLDDALRAVGADLLGPQYPYARAGFVRGALRPAGRGEGRARFR